MKKSFALGMCILMILLTTVIIGLFFYIVEPSRQALGILCLLSLLGYGVAYLYYLAWDSHAEDREYPTVIPSGVPRVWFKPIPRGAKRYHFNCEGEFEVSTDPKEKYLGTVFTTDAINDRSAILKFSQWLGKEQAPVVQLQTGMEFIN